MKNLIFQYYNEKNKVKETIETSPGYVNISRKSMEAYSQKYDLSYLFIDRELPNKMAGFYGIFMPFIEGWCFNFDNICFVDCDVIATSKAENVFCYASQDQISAHHMAVHWTPKEIAYFKNNGHINSGVVVFPRSSYSYLIECMPELQTFSNSMDDVIMRLGMYDQAFLNLFVVNRHGCHNLTKAFNYHLGLYKQTERFESNFIHYHRDNKFLMNTDQFDSRLLL